MKSSNNNYLSTICSYLSRLHPAMMVVINTSAPGVAVAVGPDETGWGLISIAWKGFRFKFQSFWVPSLCHASPWLKSESYLCRFARIFTIHWQGARFKLQLFCVFAQRGSALTCSSASRSRRHSKGHVASWGLHASTETLAGWIGPYDPNVRNKAAAINVMSSLYVPDLLARFSHLVNVSTQSCYTNLASMRLKSHLVPQPPMMVQYLLFPKWTCIVGCNTYLQLCL